MCPAAGRPQQRTDNRPSKTLIFVVMLLRVKWVGVMGREADRICGVRRIGSEKAA